MRPHTPDPRVPSLEQLLRRKDLWRGADHARPDAPATSTGHDALDALLLHRGWPLRALVEVCRQRFQGDWQLLLPALRSLGDSLLVLLNPPAEPFSQGLIQAGINLDRLVVAHAADKPHFIACFTELARTRGCRVLLGWQPDQQPLSYTELRKLQLAAADGEGLYTLFRPENAQQHSSPAALRLFCRMQPEGLAVTVFKQKGWLQRPQTHPVILPCPATWQPVPIHAELDGATDRRPDPSSAPRVLTAPATINGRGSP